MKSTMFGLCRYATKGGDGRVGYIDVFDRIGAPKLPARVDSFWIVWRFLTEYADSERTCRFRVELAGPDGSKLVSGEGQIRVGTLEPGQVQHIDGAINARNVEFPRSGSYALSLSIDGKILAEDVLAVVNAPK